MSDLLSALALVLVIEGAVFTLFPSTMRRAMARIADTPEATLRATGLLSAIFGVLAVWVIRAWQ